MSSPTSFRHRDMNRSIIALRISCGVRLAGPFGPCFRRATVGPVGFFLLSLRGLKRVKNRS